MDERRQRIEAMLTREAHRIAEEYRATLPVLEKRLAEARLQVREIEARLAE